MKKCLSVILIVLFTASFSVAAVYRSTDKDDIKRTRKAVQHIDVGHIKDGAYTLNYFTLVCVDGVKVYTTYSKEHQINTIIIPGRCDGKPEPKQPKQPKPLNVMQPKQPEQRKIGFSW